MKKVTDSSIEDTGERMVPVYHQGKSVYGEHLVRYEAAKKIVNNKVVLDIASGSGYGSAILGTAAKQVYGVDVNDQAIVYAKNNYASKNVDFIKGDGQLIPLADNRVDIVVSFETIEHIENYKGFMVEVKRVLKDDGLLILSTPNDKEFPEGAHYHVHEFKHDELKTMVKKYFKNVNEYYQLTWIYNALLDENKVTEEAVIDIETLQVAPQSLDKALYFYMLCSNRKVTESLEPLGAISEHCSERGILLHNADMDSYIKKTIKHYETIVSKKDQQIEQLNGLHTEIASLKSEIERMRSLRLWKAGEKVSSIKRAVIRK